MIDVKSLENFKYKYSYIENDTLKGYVILEETIDDVNIVDVFTYEEYRRQGVSENIFKYIMNYYKDKKNRLMLEVRSKNIPAVSLYEKLGFKCIYVRKNYYKDDDALIMEVKLK